jgi:hypothetical protein
MSGYGDKPFGLRDVKVTNIGGTSQVDLPAGRQLSVTERVVNSEMTGDDRIQAVVSFVEGLEWSLEAGGISLEALAIVTGRTATESGSTPNRTLTMSTAAGDNFPYFKIYGKSVSDEGDDIHVKIWKAKCTALEGTYQEGEFYLTSCSGIAVDDDSNGIYDVVQNETAADLPAS